MNGLNLETLSEERLRKAVDDATYLLGQRIYAQGQVQLLDFAEAAAVCSVPDKRNYRVEIKVGREFVYLKCTCNHAGRGLICEHDVAAWLAVRERLSRDLPAPWQAQIGQVLQTASYPAPRSRSAPYLLYFSLQEEQRVDESNWNVSPYHIALSHLPAELRTEPPQPSILLKERPELLVHVKPSYRRLKPGDCRNAPASLVELANMMIENQRLSNSYIYSYNYRYSDGANPTSLQNYLALLRDVQAPLYLGTSTDPLHQSVQLPQAAGSVRLSLDRSADGLHLAPHLYIGSAPVEYEIDKVKVVLEDEETCWLLAGDTLLELNAPGGPSLMAQFEQTPELFIPNEQEADFIEQYLLPLARAFPVTGSAVEWEDVCEAPTPRLYLSENEGELQGQLRFGYGPVEVRYDAALPAESIQRKPESATLVRVQRQSEPEREAYEALSSATFGLKRAPNPAPAGHFRLRARTHPVDFLLNGVPRLAAAGFEVFGEEQLKTARVNRNTPTISFNVSSGIDWFDVQTAVKFGELDVALPDIRRALRKRERYIKLADGSIGEIPEDWLERYKHLFDLGEATDEGLRLSRHHITLIEDALGEANQAHIDAEFERRRAKLRALNQENFQGVAPRDLPPGFVGELRPYQKAGYEWLHFLREFDFGGCLADDMGLGKTIQTLAFLLSLYGDPATRPAQASLLVVPRSLLVNWQRESARFTPNLRLLEFFDADRVKDTAVFEGVDLVITTYGVMLRDIQLLHGYTFHYAILDESQSIKNPLSQTARAAHLLRADHRLVLTGTPIENSTAELWSQFAFLNPGLLGSLQYFKTEFGLPIEKKSDEKSAARLRRLVFPFILRRTKDQVAPELPPRTERILYCDMTPTQRKLYVKTRDYYRDLLLGMVEKDGLNNSRMKILEGLLRLRQICNHPQLVDEKHHIDSGKFELLLETLETLQSENHKALVFSQFVQMLSLVRRELDARQTPYAYLDGQTHNRQDRVDEFQSDPNIPFFLISLKAGGLGLNLTAADYVLHIDPWWNPAVEMQASDRTHRIGQDKPVFVYKLIARDSVEEKILQLQERKKALVDQIITTESSFFKSLTVEDVKTLFS